MYTVQLINCFFFVNFLKKTSLCKSSICDPSEDITLDSNLSEQDNSMERFQETCLTVLNSITPLKL